MNTRQYLCHVLIMLAVLSPLKITLIGLLSLTAMQAQTLITGIGWINHTLLAGAALYALVCAWQWLTSREPISKGKGIIDIMAILNVLTLTAITIFGALLVLLSADVNVLHASSLVLEFRDNTLTFLDHLPGDTPTEN